MDMYTVFKAVAGDGTRGNAPGGQSPGIVQ